MINSENSMAFLLKEYSENYTHMRHYDNLSYSFIKFTFTFDLAVLSAVVAMFNYFKSDKDLIILPLGYLLLFGFCIGVLFLALAVRNRAYFVPVTRQVNRIRNFFKDNISIGFDFGDMYINPNYPSYFNVISTYSLTFYLISFLNAILLSLGVSCFTEKTVKFNLWIFIVAIAIQIISIVIYLKSKEGKTADQAIHHEGCTGFWATVLTGSPRLNKKKPQKKRK
jgi:hypothetical protein